MVLIPRQSDPAAMRLYRNQPVPCFGTTSTCVLPSTPVTLVRVVGLSRPCRGEVVPTPCAAGFGLALNTFVVSCFPFNLLFLRDLVLCARFP